MLDYARRDLASLRRQRIALPLPAPAKTGPVIRVPLERLRGDRAGIAARFAVSLVLVALVVGVVIGMALARGAR